MLINVGRRAKPKAAIAISTSTLINALPEEWPREKPKQEETKVINNSVQYNKNNSEIPVPRSRIYINKNRSGVNN